MTERQTIGDGPLAFGLNAALPSGCPLGWGARCKTSPQQLARGDFKIYPTHKDSFGEQREHHALVAILTKGDALRHAAFSLARLADHGEVHTLYRDAGIVIGGQVLDGYIYLVAYPSSAETPAKENR